MICKDCVKETERLLLEESKRIPAEGAIVIEDLRSANNRLEAEFRDAIHRYDKVVNGVREALAIIDRKPPGQWTVVEETDIENILCRCLIPVDPDP